MTSTTLYYREGSSDKVYQCSIAPKDTLFIVTFAYGRRGSTLNTGVKTTTPVDFAAAQSIFNKLVKEKTAKGYTIAENGNPYEHSDNASQVSGFVPQLLNAVEEDQLDVLTNDQIHCAQEKHDGRRLLLQKKGGLVHGINRKGLIVGLPSSLIQVSQMIPGDFVMDGEAINETLHAFDLLQVEGKDIRSQSFRIRYLALMNLLFSIQQRSIRFVETAFNPTDKRLLLHQLKKENKEGIVFKNLDAPYTAGRPNSGGSQLKFKFCATASFIVARINPKRSVSLKLHQSEASNGNVTIPPNQPIPNVGAVAEVRYLYAFENSGALFQPVYLGERDDIDPSECTADQLKFKATDSED